MEGKWTPVSELLMSKCPDNLTDFAKNTKWYGEGNMQPRWTAEDVVPDNAADSERISV